MLAGIGGLAAGALLVGKASAGPLDPPAGPIESTGKTLSDVEPRIAINSTNTPGDTDSVYRISSGGSYYLTGNVFASTGKSAIEIAASNVTIDLSGYSITSISALPAIRLSLGGRTNISIRNGHIGPAGAGGGIDLTPASGTQTAGGSIENVHVTSTGGAGIRVGDGVVLIGCTASKNGLYGFEMGRCCTVTECAAFDNDAAGFYADIECSISSCSASDNSGSGFNITLCTITGCTANRNGTNGIFAGGSTVSNCMACLNIGNGISADSGSAVINSCCRGNAGDGINCASDCVIRGNTCSMNDMSGIRAYGSGGDNRIEENHCIRNAVRGIDVAVGGNFILKNSCSGNTINWDIASGNVCFVVQAMTAGLIAGNSGGVSPGSSNPNANYTI